MGRTREKHFESVALRASANAQAPLPDLVLAEHKTNDRGVGLVILKS